MSNNNTSLILKILIQDILFNYNIPYSTIEIPYVTSGIDYEDGVVEFSHNNGDFVQCTSPLYLDNLESGIHTVILRIRDSFNSQYTESYTWEIPLEI